MKSLVESLFDADLVKKSPVPWKDLYDFLLSHVGRTTNEDEWNNWLDKLSTIIGGVKQVRLQYGYQTTSFPKNKLYLSVDTINKYLYILEKPGGYQASKILRFYIGFFEILAYETIDIDDATIGRKTTSMGLTVRKPTVFGVIPLSNNDRKEFDKFISNLIGDDNINY